MRFIVFIRLFPASYARQKREDAKKTHPVTGENENALAFVRLLIVAWPFAGVSLTFLVRTFASAAGCVVYVFLNSGKIALYTASDSPPPPLHHGHRPLHRRMPQFAALSDSPFCVRIRVSLYFIPHAHYTTLTVARATVSHSLECRIHRRPKKEFRKHAAEFKFLIYNQGNYFGNEKAKSRESSVAL